MKPGKKGLERLVDAAGYSAKGIRAVWRNEAAFRQEVALIVVLLPLSFFVAYDSVQWLLLVAPLFLVLVVELLNSAIESVVDRIGHEPHDLSGRAKDMGSASVFFCLVLIALSWGSIAWQNFGRHAVAEPAIAGAATTEPALDPAAGSRRVAGKRRIHNSGIAAVEIVHPAAAVYSINQCPRAVGQGKSLQDRIWPLTTLTGDHAPRLVPVDEGDSRPLFAFKCDALPQKIDVFRVGSRPDGDRVTVEDGGAADGRLNASRKIIRHIPNGCRSCGS